MTILITQLQTEASRSHCSWPPPTQSCTVQMRQWKKSSRNNVGNWKFPPCFYLYLNVRGISFFPPGAKTKTQSLVLELQMDVHREPLLCGERRKKILTTNPPSQMFIFWRHCSLIFLSIYQIPWRWWAKSDLFPLTQCKLDFEIQSLQAL